MALAMVMLASCRGAMRTTWGFKALGGNLRPKTAASRWLSRTVAIRAMVGRVRPFRGQQCPSPKPRPRLDALRIGWLQAGIPEYPLQGRLQRPRCREIRERNRAGHTLPAPGMGNVRLLSVIPAKAGISGGKNTNLLNTHRHSGLVPGSTPRLGHTLPVDAGTSPA